MALVVGIAILGLFILFCIAIVVAFINAENVQKSEKDRFEDFIKSLGKE